MSDIKKSQTKKSFSSIEQEINTIFELMTAKSGHHQVIRKEKVARESACKGIINVYSHIDLLRESEETAAYREAKSSGSASFYKKPFVARPKVKYAFYTDTYDQNRIGSVAIYADNVSALYGMLRKNGFLFGHAISGLSIEMGRRPFLDVTLRV